MSTQSYKDSGEYEGEYDYINCEACEREVEDGEETSHECGLEEGHEFSHKCFCGYEF